VSDLTCVAIAAGFVYVSVIVDAWLRRVGGYALSKRIDTRLAVAALLAAIDTRRRPPGCIHHSDQGVQRDLAPMISRR
jgi:putative transposase